MVKNIIKEQMDYWSINQSDLILKTGIDQKAVSEILNGKRKLTNELSAKLGSAFGLKPNWLFDYQEKSARLEKIKKDKDLVEISKLLSSWSKFKNMANASIIDYSSKIFKANSFADYKNFINNRIVGKMNYKDKRNAYLWIALMENKYGTNRSNGAFLKGQGNKLIDSVVLTMFGKGNFAQRSKKVKDILDNSGIILENGPFISDSTIYGVSLTKNRQRYIFMSDMSKRECRYIFALVHELIHVYDKKTLTEDEINNIAAMKIKKVLKKHNLKNEDMDILFDAYKTKNFDKVFSEAKARVDFGDVEQFFQ